MQSCTAARLRPAKSASRYGPPNEHIQITRSQMSCHKAGWTLCPYVVVESQVAGLVVMLQVVSEGQIQVP